MIYIRPLDNAHEMKYLQTIKQIIYKKSLQNIWIFENNKLILPLKTTTNNF